MVLLEEINTSVVFFLDFQSQCFLCILEAGTELDGQSREENVMSFDEGALLCFIGC